MKVLNLYAGIGGNRRLWTDVEVTAVELNPEIAGIYQDFFPGDKVIVGDAHEFLLANFKDYDFIWSSPPCPTHSSFRFMTTKMTNEKYSRPIVYPDMALYQEIILLKHYFEGRWFVENVIGYYEPLIPASVMGRHYVWLNFFVPSVGPRENNNFIKQHSGELKNLHGFDLSSYKLGSRKDQILRNCVEPELGLHILNYARKQEDDLFKIAKKD